MNNKLSKFEVGDILKIYLTFIYQDKELQNYINIEKKNAKKKKKGRNK